jgi:pyrophosphatase PpaX
MIDTIIFDFDGTLVNTNDVIISAWQHTYMTYRDCHMPLEHIKKCFGEPLLVTMAREFPEIKSEDAAEVYRAHQRENADELVKIFPNMEQLLKALKEKGLKVGIVTSRTRQSTLDYLRKFGIEEYFDDLVSCDDTEKHKPDPQPLLMGLKKLDAKAQNTLMIGDSVFDMKCANGAGVKTVLVGWRETTDEHALEQCQIDYEILEPMELIEIVENA